MNEPPEKKICINPSQFVINLDSDADDDDVGIQFSVSSHSSSGDRCSSSASSEGRVSFCSDGFEPVHENVLDEFVSSDVRHEAVADDDNSVNCYVSEENKSVDGTLEYEMVISDSCSISSEGFIPNQICTEDYKDAETESEFKVQVQTECLSTRSFTKNAVETNDQNYQQDSLTANQCQEGGSPEESTSLFQNAPDLGAVHREAEVIADVLGLSDVSAVDIIYKRLQQLRNEANRGDIVTNELLEGGIESMSKRLNNISSEDCMNINCDEVEQVTKAVIETIPNLSHDQVVDLLSKHSHDEERVKIVINELLEKHQQLSDPLKNITASKTKEDELFSDVQLIQKDMPAADPNMIFTLLEKFSGDKDRVSIVLNALRTSDKNDVDEPDVSDSQSEFVGMPLYDDFKIVSSLFPNQDKNEIYAYLEAHYYNPNRIQVVIEELLQLEKGSQELDESLPSEQRKFSDSGRSQSSPIQSSDICSLQKDVDILQKIFPDCDPDFLFCELEAMTDDNMRTTNLACKLFKSRNYPLLKDRLKREQAMKQLAKLKSLELNIDEFLTMFPDPKEIFYNEDKQVNDNYIKHAEQQLFNDFPMIEISYIKRKLQNHNFHYLPTKKDLNKSAEIYKKDPVAAVRSHKRFLVDHREYSDDMPSDPDELFYREVLFARNEQKIIEHIQEKRDEKAKKIAEARAKGELLECPCCYEDDCLVEDMASCPDGHLFCKVCIRRLAEANMAQAKFTFPCLDAYCELEFSLKTLQSVMLPNVFSVLLRKIQEDEVTKANIKDLVSCPYCSFASIMSDPHDKVFKCYNPECLKETCRFCQEPNHIPLRCDEVEKESEKDMRAYIEKRMSEAMIRQCWNCKKHFYKVEGCNKMTCVCGASMCYVCREPIKDYEHFAGGRCTTEDANILHLNEMKEAARKAREEYINEHPEARSCKLKYDPINHLSGSGDTMVHEYDEDDEEDDGEEETSDDDYY